MNIASVLESFGENKPQVISYTRFSSRKQAKGLSYVRQVDAAKKWCEQRGLELASENQYADLGVSAYSGANAATGALSVLQSKLAAGEIPRGTILLVEALDRLTREALPTAITLLMGLANSGLNVVTVADPDRVWNSTTMLDVGSFLMAVLTLHRGHEESAYKSLRLRETFKKHRSNGSSQAFGSAPGWLQRESNKHPWVVVEEKAAVVRRVFELSAAGYGSKAIAARANEEGWPVPTRLARTGERWHGQMPGQLLRNRAVLGEHVHRIRTHEAHARKGWRGEAAGEVIKDYYPRIVSDESWRAARASISTRAQKTRRDENFYNVFSTLMFCGCCGAPIHRKNEKNGYSRAQLNCSDRLAGATRCRTMSAVCADPQLLTAVFEKSGASLSSTEGAELLAQRAALEGEIREKRKQQARLMEAIEKGLPLPGLEARAQALADELYCLDTELQVIEVSTALASLSSTEDIVVHDVMNYLYEPGEAAKEKRASLHLQLARLVRSVWLWAYDVALVQLKDSDELIVVELMHKQLPSRSNPSSRYHKAPPPRVAPHKPHLELARAGQLIPPEPRRAAAKKSVAPEVGDQPNVKNVA